MIFKVCFFLYLILSSILVPLNREISNRFLLSILFKYHTNLNLKNQFLIQRIDSKIAKKTLHKIYNTIRLWYLHPELNCAKVLLLGESEMEFHRSREKANTSFKFAKAPVESTLLVARNAAWGRKVKKSFYFCLFIYILGTYFLLCYRYLPLLHISISNSFTFIIKLGILFSCFLLVLSL